MIGIIGNENATCRASHSVEFSKAIATIELTYDMESFKYVNTSAITIGEGDPIDTNYESECEEMLNPTSMGYDPSYDYDEFSLRVDLTALSIAVAVTMS